ncbi:hypothetical protein ABTL46_22935, partial [Acinetobacter baumannii]
TGQTLFVSARFDWPSRPVVAGLHTADTLDAAEVRQPAPAAQAAADTAMPAMAVDGAQRFSGLQYLRTGDPQLETVIQKV